MASGYYQYASEERERPGAQTLDDVTYNLSAAALSGRPAPRHLAQLDSIGNIEDQEEISIMDRWRHPEKYLKVAEDHFKAHQKNYLAHLQSTGEWKPGVSVDRFLEESARYLKGMIEQVPLGHTYQNLLTGNVSTDKNRKPEIDDEGRPKPEKPKPEYRDEQVVRLSMLTIVKKDFWCEMEDAKAQLKTTSPADGNATKDVVTASTHGWADVKIPCQIPWAKTNPTIKAHIDSIYKAELTNPFKFDIGAALIHKRGPLKRDYPMEIGSSFPYANENMQSRQNVLFVATGGVNNRESTFSECFTNPKLVVVKPLEFVPVIDYEGVRKTLNTITPHVGVKNYNSKLYGWHYRIIAGTPLYEALQNVHIKRRLHIKYVMPESSFWPIEADDNNKAMLCIPEIALLELFIIAQNPVQHQYELGTGELHLRLFRTDGKPFVVQETDFVKKKRGIFKVVLRFSVLSPEVYRLMMTNLALTVENIHEKKQNEESAAAEAENQRALVKT